MTMIVTVQTSSVIGGSRGGKMGRVRLRVSGSVADLYVENFQDMSTTRHYPKAMLRRVKTCKNMRSLAQ